MSDILEEQRDVLLDIYRAGVEAVEPGRLLTERVSRRGDELVCGEHSYRLQQNLVVVGAGKAVAAMMHSLLPLVDDHLVQAELSVPKGSFLSERLTSDARVGLHPGAEGNMPDQSAAEATASILALASSLTERHLLLVLITGGSSALLPAPRPPLTVPLKKQLTQRLFNAGGDITATNTVRGAISLSKQGRLALRALPATVITLVLSDVIDEPLQVVGSGPTWIPPSSPKQLAARAREVLASLGIECPLTEQALQALENEPAPDTAAEQSIRHVLIGGMPDALRGAERRARCFWPDCVTLSARVHGDADVTAAALADLCCHLLLNTPLSSALEQLLVTSGVCRSQLQRLAKRLPLARPLCLLLGGECSVHVRGGGRGGRCQQMALSAAVRLHSRLSAGSSPAPGHVLFAFCGTDGADGPTDATGAVCHEGTAERARSQGIDLQQHLVDNDAYGFFSRLDSGRWLVKTGLSGTNVMDLMLLLILPRQDK